MDLLAGTCWAADALQRPFDRHVGPGAGESTQIQAVLDIASFILVASALAVEWTRVLDGAKWSWTRVVIASALSILLLSVLWLVFNGGRTADDLALSQAAGMMLSGPSRAASKVCQP